MAQFTADQKRTMKTGYRMMRETCAAQWPGNDAMQHACERQQIAAAREMSLAPPDDIAPEAFTALAIHCADQWPDDLAKQAACRRSEYARIRQSR